MPPEQRHRLVRLRAGEDGVSEEDRRVGVALLREHGRESLGVAMYVGDDQDLHVKI